MARRWLVKSEPSEYAFDDLVKEGSTRWGGVTNALALRHLRTMATGDAVLVYHTGNEKAVVGTATVGRTDGPEPELKAGQPLARPVTLTELKAQARLATWELVRQPRLSVMPVTDAQWNAVLARAKVGTAGGKRKPRE